MTATRQLKEEHNECEAAEGPIRAAADADEPAPEDGMECLRSAAEEQLRQNAGKIAKALAEKAACGDLNATKILFLVIKERPRSARWRRRTGPSEAQRLAAEPPWQEPPAEPSMEPLTEPSMESLTEIEPNGVDLEN